MEDFCVVFELRAQFSKMCSENIISLLNSIFKSQCLQLSIILSISQAPDLFP